MDASVAPRQTRLARLYRGARYKEEQQQVFLPLKKPRSGDLASVLTEILEDVVPLSEVGVAAGIGAATT